MYLLQTVTSDFIDCCILKVRDLNIKLGREQYKYIKRFIISGGSCTMLHYIIMAILIYKAIDPVYATVYGAIAGATLNYFLQYYYTFESKRGHGLASLTYLINLGVSFLINILIFIFFYKYFNIHVVMAQIITTGIVMVYNYLIYKLFIFMPNKS